MIGILSTIFGIFGGHFLLLYSARRFILQLQALACLSG